MKRPGGTPGPPYTRGIFITLSLSVPTFISFPNDNGRMAAVLQNQGFLPFPIQYKLKRPSLFYYLQLKICLRVVLEQLEYCQLRCLQRPFFGNKELSLWSNKPFRPLFCENMHLQYINYLLRNVRGTILTKASSECFWLSSESRPWPRKDFQ
jgi:hypothetical protein